MGYDAGLPWAYNYLLQSPQKEDDDRVFLSSDLCVVNNWFFVRGCIEIPVIDTGNTFIWTAWALISRDKYARTLRMWENRERVFERPYKGLLATEIPGYRKTLFLKLWVHSRRVGERALIELKRSKNRLSIEQYEGITQARVREIAAKSNYIRVIDNEAEDYLYPADYFIVFEFPTEVERALLRAS